MADRYWVGGTGSWTLSGTTNWSATSGGASGASAPTSADDVYFDANSGTGTVTVISARECNNITFTGFAGTLTGSTTPIISFYGNVVLSTGMTITANTVTFRKFGSSAATFLSSGKTIFNLSVEGVGGSLTLSDALTFSTIGTLTVTNGTFSTNNYNVTGGTLSSSNSNARTINLGSSTLTLSGGSAVLFTTDTNLTLNAGTSSIIVPTGGTFSGGAVVGGTTFNDVSFTSTTTGGGITGINVFNNLSTAGRTTAGVSEFSINSNQTITGTLTLSAGTNATMRTFVRSSTIGTARTLTCANVASLTDIDFRDIAIAGAAAPVSGTRLGDCKGNSGITFPAAKTVYCRSTGSANWSATTGWSSTNGGASSVTQFPLAQDTAVFPSATYPASGSTITVDASYNIGTIDMSARTSNTMTLATGSTAPTVYGNWINGTGITLTGSSTLIFAGRGSQTITSAGKTFPQGVTTNSPGGSVTQQDALITTGTLGLSSGTYDANGYNLTAVFVSSSNTAVRTLALGSGTWTINGGGAAWSTATATNLTVTGTGTISLVNAGNKTFSGGGVQTWPTLNQGGTGTLTITGSNKFANITDTAIGRVQFTGGTTNTFDAFNLSGTAGNLLQLGSTNTTQATLQKSTAWLMGANSTDGGNNTGLSFTAGGGIDYLSVSYINGALTVILASVFESATGADVQYPVSTFNINVPETVVASDTLTTIANLQSALSEAATGADFAEAIRLFVAAVSEATTVSELVAASRTLSFTVAEAAQVADSPSAQAILDVPVSEIVSAAESLSGGLLFTSGVSEAAVVAEITEALRSLFGAIQEFAQFADTPRVASTFSATSTEIARPLDTSQGANTGSSSLAETATASEAAVARFVAVASAVEQSAAQDSAAALMVFRTNVQESSAGADTPRVVPSTFSATSTEIARPLDTPQGANTGSSSLAETATASETAGARFVASATAVEQSTVQDSAVALMVFRTSVQESSAGTDTPRVAPSTFRAVAAAAVQAVESFSPAGSVYNVTLPIEGAGITDSLIGAFLWNLILTAQDPNWTSIQNPQNPGWTSIDDSQDPGWQNIDIT